MPECSAFQNPANVAESKKQDFNRASIVGFPLKTCGNDKCVFALMRNIN